METSPLQHRDPEFLMFDVEDYSVMKCSHFLLNLPRLLHPRRFRQVPERLFTLREWLHTCIILMTGGCTDTR